MALVIKESFYIKEVDQYRYTFNGQESENEITGVVGANTTALYWEYDSRLGRRWNLDPKPQISISDYSCFSNNPNSLVDIDGRAAGNPDGYPSGGQATYSPLKSSETGFAIRHPYIAYKIGMNNGTTNISSNSVRFSTRKDILQENTSNDKEQGMGSQVNAFRHTIWQGTITAKFGSNIAEEAGYAHEDNPSADLTQRTFKGANAMADADQTVDLLNNIIGRQIGSKNQGSDMKTISLKALDFFKTTGLYTATKNTDGSVVINLTRITSAQYIKMKATIIELNSNGENPAEVEANKKAEIQLQNGIGNIKPLSRGVQ